MAVIRTKRKCASIPTASMADVSFLLLLFFMVSTVFVKEKGLKVTLPKAETLEKIPRNNAATIYVNSRGVITIDDMPLTIEQVRFVMEKKYNENYNIIGDFRTDKNTDY